MLAAPVPGRAGSVAPRPADPAPPVPRLPGASAGIPGCRDARGNTPPGRARSGCSATPTA
ncbi:hypothetical protein F1189_31025 [Rhodovastum atsumiense]|uniref:Uncharacterized protein n=1 Tax=Rhodovastum atsumiense TaxID=504468 RepID=A0A5M6IID6_9PROT|nr:hypothetical protein F1189_31025 [Rhodovastum atsumiense]